MAIHWFDFESFVSLATMERQYTNLNRLDDNVLFLYPWAYVVSFHAYLPFWVHREPKELGKRKRKNRQNSQISRKQWIAMDVFVT